MVTPFRENQEYNWSMVAYPITDNEVREWVDALRSGLFKQGHNMMYNERNDSFCCLGVLGFIQSWENVSKSPSFLISEKPRDFSRYYKLPFDLQVHLSKMNDLVKNSFNQIADFIEEGFGLI